MAKPHNVILGLLGAALGGSLCVWLKTPLPWVVGPLVTMATCNFSGALRCTTIGARARTVFDRDDARPIFHARRRRGEFGHAPVLMAAAFGSIMIGYIASRVLLHYTRAADATAFFASVLGSATEMANLGDHFGAAVDRVAVAHSLRILLVACTVPVFMTISDVHGGDVYQLVVIAFNWTELIQLFAIVAFGGALLS